jgi:hypothetical protein
MIPDPLLQYSRLRGFRNSSRRQQPASATAAGRDDGGSVQSAARAVDFDGEFETRRSHRSFTAKIAKEAETIARNIASLTHRPITALCRE